MDGALPDVLESALDLHIRQHAGRASTATFVQPAPGTTLSDLALRLGPDLVAHGSPGWLTGRQLMEDELRRVLGRELLVFTGLGLLANVIIVWAGFPSARMTVAVMLPPVLTVTLSLAALHAAGLALTPITIVTLPLVLGIGVDSCAYLAERYRGGATLDVAASSGGRAVVMSSITTMIGFGFLASSRFPGLSELGALTASAMALALLSSFTVLPICLNALCPQRER
jgi:predicted RND superfamily exporter protein